MSDNKSPTMSTTVETFEKALIAKSKVEAQMQAELDSGASECAITDDATNWILTCKWPIIE
jgi:hypothetical protein